MRVLAGCMLVAVAWRGACSFVAAPHIAGGAPQPRLRASAPGAPTSEGPGALATASVAMGLVLGLAAARPSSVARKAEEPGKINCTGKIEPDSPKVVTQDKLKAGDKKVYCRCWLSGTFPMCDGSHAKHNDKTGDNVGPLIVAVEK
mmetsp:Transcript_41295/g.122581  ORF Transcript_41295/g.122581 Transcript_41295/m.122581 type:complete len:146 (-) Transcript_41295:235-672(-)